MINKNGNESNVDMVRTDLKNHKEFQRSRFTLYIVTEIPQCVTHGG